MPFDKKVLIGEICHQASILSMPPPLVTRLVKLLYLADIEWRRKHKGEPISDLTWKFHHYGPYAFELSDILGGPDVELAEFKNGKTGRFYNCALSDISAPVPDELRKLLKDLVARWGDTDLNMLLDFVYFDTEPMENATRGAALDFSVLTLCDVNPTPKLDTKKLHALRANLKARVKHLNMTREGSLNPRDEAGDKVWDDDEPYLPFAPETPVKYQPKS